MRLTERATGLKSVQEINGALGVRGGLKDGSLVVLQHLQPGAQIGGVVVAWLRRDTQVRAEIGCPDFGDQFFTGVPLVAKLPAAEIAVESRRVLRPVELMPISA